MARSRDVSKSYSVDSKKRKYEKKHTSLAADAETSKQHNANGPPDKAKDIKAAKRAQRRGKGVINSMVEVEYKEKNGWRTLLFGMVEEQLGRHTGKHLLRGHKSCCENARWQDPEM